MLVSLLNPGDWGFGTILMIILVLNVAVFLFMTFAPKVHNSITAAIRTFIDFMIPRAKPKA